MSAASGTGVMRRSKQNSRCLSRDPPVKKLLSNHEESNFHCLQALVIMVSYPVAFLSSATCSVNRLVETPNQVEMMQDVRVHRLIWLYFSRVLQYIVPPCSFKGVFTDLQSKNKRIIKDYDKKRSISYMKPTNKIIKPSLGNIIRIL